MNKGSDYKKNFSLNIVSSDKDDFKKSSLPPTKCNNYFYLFPDSKSFYLFSLDQRIKNLI